MAAPAKAFFKAISKLINTVLLMVKILNWIKVLPSRGLALDTQLIVVEDCRRNVDFEGFYSNITEGVTVEKEQGRALY